MSTFKRALTMLSFYVADKLSVLSFLEALEDSVLLSESQESKPDGGKDLTSQSCNHGDPMDEGR